MKRCGRSLHARCRVAAHQRLEAREAERPRGERRPLQQSAVVYDRVAGRVRADPRLEPDS